MRILKPLIFMLCIALLGSLSVKTARADEYNKLTIMTFSAPVEIPGYHRPTVLPAGSYMFKLLDTAGERNIVQIFNKNGTHLYATVLAIPDMRMKPTGKTAVKFEENSANSPEALKAWFYPGDVYGQEFVYSKTRAAELAKQTNQPVLSMPDETAANITKPIKSNNEAAVTAMKNAPVKAEQPNGQEVEMATVVTSPTEAVSNQAASNRNNSDTANNSVNHDTNSKNHDNLEAKNNTQKNLPKTASDMPLLALMGLMLCGAGFSLRALARRVD